MRKIYRQLLLFSSAVVFLALAPLIVFYAMGYRPGLQPGDTLPVGVLQLDSEPRDAVAAIDGSVIGDTPRSISNIPPGVIDVALSFDGYHTWQKKVTINPASVTEFRSVRLFPTNTTPVILRTTISSFSLAPNRRLVAALDDTNALQIFDEAGSPIIPPTKLSAPVTKLLWSPDSNSLLIYSQSSVSLLDITDQSLPTRLPRLAPDSDISWDPRIPGRLIQLQAGKLSAYHIKTDTRLDFLDEVTSFATTTRHIYAVTTSNEIEVINLQGQAVPIEFPNFSKPIDQLLITPAGQVAIKYDDTSLDLLDEGQLIPIASSSLKSGWSPDGQLMYIQTDPTSLHVFNAFDERIHYLPWQQSHLVLRLSNDIRDPQWFAGGHHLIYQVNDEIIITEIDTRDHPISYTVDSTNLGNSGATVGEDGDSLLYLKRNSRGQQLYRTSLVVEDK